MASPPRMNGAILARPPRPIPKQARRLWVNSARTALRRARAADPRSDGSRGRRCCRRGRSPRSGWRAISGAPLMRGGPRGRGRGAAPDAAAGAGTAGRPTGLVAEQVLEALAALLDPDERQPELGDRVADDVERRARR